MTAQGSRGWVFFENDKLWHYVAGVRTICRRWIFTGDTRLLSDAEDWNPHNYTSSDICPECRRRKNRIEQGAGVK